MCVNLRMSSIWKISSAQKYTPPDFPDWLMEVCVLKQYVLQAAKEVNLFNMWTQGSFGNFLWLYMWGGSGSAGGASCPLQSGGRLLCGYNMVGQVYCL